MKLEEAIIILPKSKIKAGDGKKEGKYPLYRSSNKLDTYYDEYLLDEEVIIIGTGGNPSIHYNKGKCAYTTQCLVLKSKGEFENKYIYYYLLSRLNKIKRMFRGLAIKQLDKKAFFKLDILLVDKVKQKRIIENLDKISNNIQSKKEQLKNLEKLVKSQFVEMFGDIKIKEKMKNVSVYFSRGKTPNYVEKSNIKVISQACIYWDEFKYEKAKYQDENKALKSLEKMIENGDVLITSTGTGTLGRCNVYYGEEHKYMADSHVSILRLNYKEVNPIFFKYYFMQEKVQKELYAECVNGSTNQIELSKDRFLNFRILMPEITLQNQFSEIVKQIDKQKFEIEKSLKETQELYESLMEEYFKGERR